MRHWGAAFAIGVLAIGAVALRPVMAQPRPASGAFVLEGQAVQGSILRGTVPPGTRSLEFDGVAIPVAPDGRFLIAFDRDAPPAARLVATTDAGPVTLPIVVAPRAWRIERLDTVPKVPVPTADYARRRPGELAQINAARRTTLGNAQGWRQRFQWPAIGRISGLFGAQRVYRGEPGAYHSGVDIAKGEGAMVYAPADGYVILAADSPFTLEGNLLMLDHGMGLNSAFLHLSRIDVHVGEYIRQGEPIGLVGHTGRASGPHLHWAMKWHESRIDPLLVAGQPPVPTTYIQQ